MDLTDFMRAEGLNDAALAIKVGVDRSNVTRWRRGDTKPGFDALVALEKFSEGKVTAKDFAG